MDLIIAESGVAKATFYKHFPAKDQLVLAYLDKVDRIWSAQLQLSGGGGGESADCPARRHVRRAGHRLPA